MAKKVVKKMAKRAKPQTKPTNRSGASMEGGGTRSPGGNARVEFYKRLVGQRATMKRGGGMFWSPEEGQSRIRPIPYINTDGELTLFEPTDTHFKVHPDHNALPCPGAQCPICRLAQTVTGEDAKKLTARRRFAFNCLVRDGEDPDKLHIAEVATTVASGILEIAEMDDYPDIFSPDHGRDFLINRSGSGLDTKYTVHAAGRTSKVGIDLDEVELYDLTERRRKALSAVDLESIAKQIKEILV